MSPSKSLIYVIFEVSDRRSIFYGNTLDLRLSPLEDDGCNSLDLRTISPCLNHLCHLRSLWFMLSSKSLIYVTFEVSDRRSIFYGNTLDLRLSHLEDDGCNSWDLRTIPLCLNHLCHLRSLWFMSPSKFLIEDPFFMATHWIFD